MTVTFSEDFSSGSRIEVTWDDGWNNDYSDTFEVLDWDRSDSVGWISCSGSTCSFKSFYDQKAGDIVDIHFWSSTKITAVSIASESTAFCGTSSS